jgi:regulation of enolase protein 1 (concanavalin A-like superfamily)
MDWINPPASSELGTFTSDQHGASFDFLNSKASGRSDYWRKTHYGFVRESGNFFCLDVESNFEVTVAVSGKYRERYDQAGLMMLADDENWVKLGIEYVDGIQKVSAVVTRDYSDWSVIQLEDPPERVFFKVKYVDGSFEVFYSLDGENFILYRLAFLSGNKKIKVGVTLASPDCDDGVEVQFRDFRIRYLG